MTAWVADGSCAQRFVPPRRCSTSQSCPSFVLVCVMTPSLPTASRRHHSQLALSFPMSWHPPLRCPVGLLRHTASLPQHRGQAGRGVLPYFSEVATCSVCASALRPSLRIQVCVLKGQGQHHQLSLLRTGPAGPYQTPAPPASQLACIWSLL